jgi:hypothetical protein
MAIGLSKNAGKTNDYDTIVSHPLAARYVAKFMHQAVLLTQFQHVEQEDTQIDEDLTLTKQLHND